MLIRRCAWHVQYRGYPRYLGITNWGEAGITFSDGLCPRCAELAREEWNLPPRTPPRIVRSGYAACAAGLVVAAAIGVGLVMGPPEPESRVASLAAPLRVDDRASVAMQPVAAEVQPQPVVRRAGPARGLPADVLPTPRAVIASTPFPPRIVRARARHALTVAYAPAVDLDAVVEMAPPPPPAPVITLTRVAWAPEHAEAP